METQPINYAALAEQARKGAPVDYAALAERARQEAATPTAPPSLLDRAKANFNAATQGAQPGDGAIKGALANFGAGGGDAIRGIYHAIQHPIDTVVDMATTDPLMRGNSGEVQKKQIEDAPAMRTLGNLGAQAVMGEVGAGAVGRVAPLATKVASAASVATGEAAADAGTGLMNKTIGTLKSDFKRGANPGRGYLETGNGPAVSMRSIADKASEAKDVVGTALGNAYKAATDSGIKIPVDQVAAEMSKPLQKAIDLETGPGGTGNLAAIKGYVQNFAATFDKAAANGGFTPSELFKMKRDIAENTNWSDPAQFSLKSVRQQQTGALAGILSDVVPETADLNQHYQDLTKFVERATERANTGSRPLTAHIYKMGMPLVGALAGGAEGNPLAGAAIGAAMDSVPVKTTLATGLFRGGKALSRFGEGIAPANGTSVEGIASGDMPNDAAYAKSGNPQDTPPRLGDGTTNAEQLRQKAKERFKKR